MLTWAAAKLFFGGLWQKFMTLLAFLLKPRQVFMPLLIPVAICIGVYVLWGQRDAAIKTHADYQEQVRVATEQRKLDNAKKETELKTIMQTQIEAHEAEINKLRGLYNATKHKSTTLARTNADLRSQLRNEIEAAAALRLSGGFNRPVGLAEGRGNCDATDSGYGLEAYTNTLELAAATTTSDYNTLYARCSAINKIYGGK